MGIGNDVLWRLCANWLACLNQHTLRHEERAYNGLYCRLSFFVMSDVSSDDWTSLLGTQ